MLIIIIIIIIIIYYYYYYYYYTHTDSNYYGSGGGVETASYTERETEREMCTWTWWGVSFGGTFIPSHLKPIVPLLSTCWRRLLSPLLTWCAKSGGPSIIAVGVQSGCATPSVSGSSWESITAWSKNCAWTTAASTAIFGCPVVHHPVWRHPFIRRAEDQAPRHELPTCHYSRGTTRHLSPVNK